MQLTSQQMDRAVGAVIGSAAGDALGSQYEFGPSHPDDFVPVFGVGVFGHEVGTWTDDTEMAIPILRQLAGRLPNDEFILHQDAWTAIGREWAEWAGSAKDVGAQTRAVLTRAARIARDQGDESVTWKSLFLASEEHHNQAGRSGGNGALMRTTPVALAGFASNLRHGDTGPDSDTVADAAANLARLTHWEADNADACVLWSLAIQHAIVTGELSFENALRRIATADADRARRWRELIDAARALGAHPRDFQQQNGWVVRAFQAALSAVTGAESYPEAIYRAIRGGGDTDTVAAITGSLAGALWGLTQVPLAWQRKLHGWPGADANDLKRWAIMAVRGGGSEACEGWPHARTALRPDFLHTAPVQHPLDAGVWLGSQSALTDLPSSVDAVVSLCRVGRREVPRGLESVQVWLVDTDGQNLNLDRTLVEAADIMAEFRAEGKEVFVHCAEARSRTAAVAALYALRHCGVRTLEGAWTVVRETLPHFDPAPFLREAVTRIVQQAAIAARAPKANGPLIRIARGDITEQQVDVIVNAANSRMRGGGGVDGAIHRRGGPAILRDCVARFPDGLAPGDAGWTTAGNLPANWVIHTVGPDRRRGQTDPETLASCYRRALEAADELGARSVAFPLIGAGVFGWPLDIATEIAVSTVAAAATEAREITFVAFGDEAYAALERALDEVRSK